MTVAGLLSALAATRGMSSQTSGGSAQAASASSSTRRSRRDLASAISAAFADELVAELQSARSAIMLQILKPLRTRCVELLVEFFAKRDDASIDTMIALGAISIAMSVRTIAGEHEAEHDVAYAELLVARAAQDGLSRLFAQEGAPTWA